MSKPLGTCIIDPPWEYQQASKYERSTGYSTGYEYESIKTDALAKLPIAELADYGFLWTTGPFIEDSYKIIRSWGMIPISMLAWVKCAEIYTAERPAFEEPDVKFKPRYGVGYWFRGCVEPIILFRRPGVPAYRTNWVGLLSESAKHSRKPNTLHHLIETSFPKPYLELFGRRSMPGWTVLGNQAPEDGLDIHISISNLLAQRAQQDGELNGECI